MSGGSVAIVNAMPPPSFTHGPVDYYYDCKNGPIVLCICGVTTSQANKTWADAGKELDNHIARGDEEEMKKVLDSATGVPP